MSLTVQSSFGTKINSVLPLAQTPGVQGIAVRIASLASDILGSLTANGAGGTVAFTISSSAPSFLTGTVDSTGTIFTLSFSNAIPNGPDPYEFYVTITDGVTTTYFPILLEVKEPFAIQEVNNLTTFNIPSFDSTVANVVIEGIGLNGSQVGGINFVPPASLPSGLNFINADGSTVNLHVNDPSPASSTVVSGGLQLATPVSVPLTITAYRPGSFYDEPDRAFTKTFQVSSLTSKQGTIDFMVDVYWDDVNSRFQIDIAVDYLKGQGKALQYSLTNTGSASGSFSSASGNVTSTGLVSTTFTPAGNGTLIINVTLADQLSPHPVYGLKTVGPFNTSFTNSTWEATTAIKLQLSTAPGGAGLYSGFVGDTVNVIVSAVNTAEFTGPETFTLTVTAENGSNIESNLTVPAGPFTLTSGSLTATIPITIPAATPREKWGIRIAASNGSTRTGFAEATIRTFGKKTLVINSGSSIPISTQTGAVMTPISLTALDVETSSPIAATFSLIGAPDGVFISGSTIVGNALAAGIYTFRVYANFTGYAPSQSGLVTLTVTQNATPLIVTTPTIIGATLNPPAEQDNTNYNVQWSITGTPTTLKFLQSTSSSGSRNVLGTTQAATTQPTTSVISVFGSSYFGTAYSVPIIVLSTSIQASSQLLSSPTIGTVDSNSNLTLNWQPFLVNGGYSIYRAWNIFLTKVPGGTPQLQTINGNLPTGLEFPGSTTSNRIFESVLVPGDYTVNMTALTSNPALATNSNPWDTSHQFPPTLSSASVDLSLGTVLLGQPLTISLDPAYTGADTWSVTFADNTTTGFVPLSVRSFAKSFSTPGSQTITITTQNDFSTANPPVKLRRTIVLTVFVVNQQFNPGQAGAGDLTGTLGISGAQGFEITDATTSFVTPQPWEVVSRNLVRDTITNELKLMVATSRFSNASSLLDTMAIDVFPIQGRPLGIELIDIPALLAPQANTSGSPVKITTTTLPGIIVGKPMTEFKLQASGGIGPYSWYTDSSLPNGLNLSIDGTLSGTPLTLGNFTVNFSVVDTSGPDASIASISLSFTVSTDLVITTTSLDDATVNTPYSLQLTNTGGLPPFAWAIVSGSFPRGLSVDGPTGLLSGIPATYNSTLDFATVYTGTIQITDAIGAKISKTFSMHLLPADLEFGTPFQTTVYAEDQFKLTVPVFGGKSPYTLVSFSDDGVIGSGLQIVNPQVVTLVGVAPATLTITTGNQSFFPQATISGGGAFVTPPGVAVAFTLSSTGGVAPIQYSIDGTATNTLTHAAVYGTEVVAVVEANGQFQIGIKAVDAVGHIATILLQIFVQAQNSAPYTISPISVNLNGAPTTPGSWTGGAGAASSSDFRITSGVIPDAVSGTPYSPGSGQIYGFALYQNNQIYYLAEPSGHATFNPLAGAPWPTWFVPAAPNGLSLPGIVFINQTGGSTPGVGDIGSTSVLTEFDSIVQPSTSVLYTAKERESITVRSSGSGTTPVVVVVDTASFTIDLATTPTWSYPLVAEGGTGPYTFQIQGGTNLPGVTLTTGADAAPFFTSSTTVLGTYSVIVKATDSASHVSANATITVTIIQSAQQPIHILNNNLPPYLYIGRPIPSNTYFIQSDLVANWTGTGLPAGVTLTAAAGTRTFLAGTPTAVGTNTMVVTATSASFGTSATQNFPLQIKARSASTVAFPTTATIGVSYRAVNNNAILNVAYVGYQPTDSDLPLLTSSTGTVGAPGVSNGGQPTTQISNLTFDGFTMAYDYQNNAVGNDTIGHTTSNPIGGLGTIQIVYPTLVATGTTPAVNVVSEYATTAAFAAPVSIVGGNPPYLINITGESDSRFVPQNNNTATAQLGITVNQFAPGGTYTCSANMTVQDTEGTPQSSSTTGILTIQIKVETTITVQYNDQPWTIPAATSPNIYNLVLPVAGVTVQLAHQPVQFNVTSVTIPGGLTGKVIVSPSNRVIAINTTGSSANVSDVNASLAPSGSYTVTATSTSGLAGTYTIGVSYQVIDSHGITSTGTKNVNVTIS